MGRFGIIVVTAAVAGVGLAGVALAGGGPPPAVPASDPPAFTVVATGGAAGRVNAPARQTDASIGRAVRAARTRLLPVALAEARAEAADLGAAARLRPLRIVAVRRDVAPFGWSQDEGRFGPGVWCGRIYTGRRTVTRADGTTRRVNRYRDGCAPPRQTTLRVTVTFAAEPA